MSGLRKALYAGLSRDGKLPISGVKDLMTDLASRSRMKVFNIRDYGAKGDGVHNDGPALVAAVRASMGAFSPYRTPTGFVYIPLGKFRIEGAQELAEAEGILGLTIYGGGSGSALVYWDSAATISITSSRAITLTDFVCRSRYPETDGFDPSEGYGIDLEQVFFTVHQEYGTNPLKQWRVNRLEFEGGYMAFSVTGPTDSPDNGFMCDGFNFLQCQFSQMYCLAKLDNGQAVNWCFEQCTYENESLETVKPHGEAKMFWMTKGCSITWNGGGIIGHGYWFYFDLQESSLAQRTTHFWVVRDVRAELASDDGTPDGYHAPLVGRSSPADGFVSAGNSIEVLFDNVKGINRSGMTDQILAELWDRLTLTMQNCSLPEGRVMGKYTSNSGTQYGQLRLLYSPAIQYVEDTTDLANNRLSHSITIRTDEPGEADQDIRPADNGLATQTAIRVIRSSGPTGIIPRDGALIAIPPLLKHTILRKLFINGMVNLVQSLTVELCELDDPATVYGTVTVDVGERYAEAMIGAEIGFQIPENTPLALKPVGADTTDRGEIGIEYC